MTETDEIAAWLRKQAEADIEAAGKATPGPWEFEGDDPTDDELFTVHDGEHGDLVGNTVAYVRGYGQQVANGRHMERHDPLTETARAESVLRMVDLYEQTAALVREPPTVTAPRWPGAEPQPGMISARDYLDALRELAALDHVVRLLATGYRHREGYEAARKP